MVKNMVKNMKGLKGYKVFDPNWTCRGFQYEIGKTYVEDVEPKCCNKGFHFCKDLMDCFNYYAFNSDNKVAEVIAIGDVDEEQGGSKCCTNKIQIIREISWGEVLKIVNTGKRNTGYYNSGDHNSGNHNSGNWNSGNYNSGNHNSGYYNSGNWNSGDCNSGDYNSGYYNSGDWNSGNHNSGNYNSGNHNSGNHNSGYYNSGDWNKTNYSSGCFNTLEQDIFMFNKPSSWTYEDWECSAARRLLNRIPKKDCAQIWWDGLSEQDKNSIERLPNFNVDIFKEITGIDVSCKY